MAGNRCLTGFRAERCVSIGVPPLIGVSRSMPSMHRDFQSNDYCIKLSCKLKVYKLKTDRHIILRKVLVVYEVSAKIGSHCIS